MAHKWPGRSRWNPNGPELNHSVGESDLVTGMKFVAKGMCCLHAPMNQVYSKSR